MSSAVRPKPAATRAPIVSAEIRVAARAAEAVVTQSPAIRVTPGSVARTMSVAAPTVDGLPAETASGATSPTRWGRRLPCSRRITS